jgi:uncharacterized protein YeaO (DUF488 family)/DNA-binding MarR family transcriptional regulator
MTTEGERMASEHLTKQDFEELARFRFGIRRYLRFSEETVRSHGITPQHYQLMLALKGFPGREWATMSELADRLQLRHHSVVELVDRAQKQDLVERSPDPTDARAVRVGLAEEGQRALMRLSALHRNELRRMGTALTLPIWDDAEGERPAVRIRRVYDESAPEDGVRVLVDRLWPRGLRKDAVELDEWHKDVAPSAELRTWFGHATEKFAEFTSRYHGELDTVTGRAALDRLRDLTKGRPLTLLTATKDVEHSHATVLAGLLREHP